MGPLELSAFVYIVRFPDTKATEDTQPSSIIILHCLIWRGEDDKMASPTDSAKAQKIGKEENFKGTFIINSCASENEEA